MVLRFWKFIKFRFVSYIFLKKCYRGTIRSVVADILQLSVQLLIKAVKLFEDRSRRPFATLGDNRTPLV